MTSYIRALCKLGYNYFLLWMIIFEVVKLGGWEIAHSMAFFISFLMISIKNIDHIHIKFILIKKESERMRLDPGEQANYTLPSTSSS